MTRTIGLILFSFGLLVILIGAFYKLFLHNKKRNLLFPKYDRRKKGSTAKELFNLSKFIIGLDINIEVWIGVVYIAIMLIVLLTVLVLIKFTPESFYQPFITKIFEFAKILFNMNI